MSAHGSEAPRGTTERPEEGARRASGARRERRRHARRTPRLGRLVLSLSLVMVAAGLLLAWPAYLARTGSPLGDLLESAKPWTWRVIAEARQTGTVRDLASGARVAPGDRLRFEARTEERTGWAAIVGFDSAGKVTPLLPAQGRAVEVPPGRASALGAAVELDGPLGEGRLELLGCREAVSIAELVEAGKAALARAGGKLHALALSARGCDRTTFWLEKATP